VRLAQPEGLNAVYHFTFTGQEKLKATQGSESGLGARDAEDPHSRFTQAAAGVWPVLAVVGEGRC
jgi:hypothetical protein